MELLMFVLRSRTVGFLENVILLHKFEELLGTNYGLYISARFKDIEF